MTRAEPVAKAVHFCSIFMDRPVLVAPAECMCGEREREREREREKERKRERERDQACIHTVRQ